MAELSARQRPAAADLHEAIFLYARGLKYGHASELQADLLERRKSGTVSDILLFTEHPPVYTLGKNARAEHLLINQSQLRAGGFELHQTDRGGDITYHGPGQLVGYPIINLNDYYRDVGRFLREIEESLIRTLAHYGIEAGRESGLTGVWVDGAKVAAIGVKLSRWYTKHGFALNINTDLSHFDNIIPCGISNKPVTSMQQLLGRELDFDEVAGVAKRCVAEIFGMSLQEEQLSGIATG